MTDPSSTAQLVPGGAVFILVGVLIAVLPAKWLILVDRKTGAPMVRRAPTREIGLQRAAILYKIVGTLFALLGVGMVAMGLLSR